MTSPIDRVPSRRLVAAQGQAAVTRERLVFAFATAFAEHGYLAVNLNDVLGELGLTKGAFYFHFPSKDEVAREIVQRYLDRWEPTMRMMSEPDSGALDTLVDTVRAVGRAFQIDPVARAGARLASERSVIEAALPRPFVDWIAAFTELLAAGQARGEVSEAIDPARYANLIVAVLFGALQVSGELARRRDLLQRLEVFWEAVLPAMQPAPRPSARTVR